MRREPRVQRRNVNLQVLERRRRRRAYRPHRSGGVRFRDHRVPVPDLRPHDGCGRRGVGGGRGGRCCAGGILPKSERLAGDGSSGQRRKQFSAIHDGFSFSLFNFGSAEHAKPLLRNYGVPGSLLLIADRAGACKPHGASSPLDSRPLGAHARWASELLSAHPPAPVSTAVKPLHPK